MVGIPIFLPQVSNILKNHGFKTDTTITFSLRNPSIEASTKKSGNPIEVTGWLTDKKAEERGKR